MTYPHMYETTYRNNYKGTHTEKVLPAKFIREIQDPIVGSFYEYLAPESRKQTLPPNATFEPHVDFTQRLVCKHPALRRRLWDEPVDMKVVDRSYLDLNRTVYQVLHCRIEDGFMSAKKRARGTMDLPKDWPVPYSIYRSSYRGPAFRPPGSHITLNLVPKRCVPPPNNLDPNETARRLLEVKTRESDYGGVIGDLGGKIIMDEYYGPMKLAEDPEVTLERLAKERRILLIHVPQDTGLTFKPD